MDQISKVLFVISNSLLIPDILFLIILFIRSLILVGASTIALCSAAV